MKLAEKAFEMGDFKLYIKIFEKCSICFYNLGVNQFHDNLLNLLLAVILTDTGNGSLIFNKLKYDSLWEMKVYEL